MGRLKSLTILMTLGAWGTATDGAPPDDAAPPASSTVRPQLPEPASKYLKAAQALAKKATQTGSKQDSDLAAQYLRVASDYRDQLTSEEQATLDGLSRSAVAAPVATPSANHVAGGGLASRGTSPNDSKQKARWLLQSSKEQMLLGHYDDAEAKIEEARAMDVRWTLFDETPAKVSELLEKTRPKAAVAGGPKGDRRQAKAKLKEARDLLASGQYEQAEAIAADVDSWGVRFNMLEDTPIKVASAARALRRRDVARNAKPGGVPADALYGTLVASARQLMQAGRMDEAESKAREAAGLNASPGLTADRAESVLNDIAVAKASRPSPTVAANDAPFDPQVTVTSAEAPIAEPASVATERAANDLLARGDTQAAQGMFAQAQALKAQEDAAFMPVSAPPTMDGPLPVGLADAPSNFASAPPELAPAPVNLAEMAVSDAPEPAPSAPVGPGDSSLDQARELLANGNYPAARQAAMQARAEGAGLEADGVIAQIGQTEQAAAFQIYESALAAIRKGTETDMAHARGLLNELSTLEGLDESTMQRVQDLLMKLPREGAGHAEIGSSLDDKEAVAAQKLNAEVGTKVAEARRLMETDPDKAITLLNSTLDAVKSAGMKESVTRTMSRRLEVAVELAKKDKSAFDVKMKDKAYRTEIEKKRLRILEADKAKGERIKDLMAKYEDAMAEGRFEEGEKFAGMAADIDPNNLAAIAGRTVARTRRYYEQDLRNRADKDNMAVELMQDVDRAGIMSRKLIRDDIDPGQGFATLTESRRALARRLSPQRTQAVIDVEKSLEKPIETISLEKTTLSEAVKYLGELTGQNFIIDDRALAEEGATLNTPVSISGNRLKLKTVLKFLLRNLNLTYTVDGEGVIVITSEQAKRANTVTRVYNVTDLVVPINNRPKDPSNLAGGRPGLMADSPYGGNPDAALQAQAAAMSGNGGGFAVPGNQDVYGQQGGQRDDRQIDFNPLISIIKSAVAPGTWRDQPADPMSGSYGQGGGLGGDDTEDVAIGSITPFFLNISLIIRHTAEVHDDIVDLLRQLRRLQDLQVSVEVRFITVSDSFFEQIGVDFDFSIQSDAVGKGSSFAIQNPAAIPGSTTTGATTAVNPFLINPIRDHAIGGQPPLTIGHTGNSGGNGNPGEFTSDLQIPFQQGSAGVIAPFNALTGNTAATFGIAFLSDLEVYLFLTAVQGDTRSNLVQAPKVTSFNGSNATVSNFTSRNYVSQLTPIVGAGSVAFFPTIGQVPDGVILNVTPVVSADRRYVRMSLSPQFITFIQFDTFTIPAAVGGGGLGGQSSAINAQVQLPVFSLTNIQTTVTVPDGGTVLLGGVKRLREERREFGVPILSKTPWINRLFKNIGIGRTTDSLMLMVTPRIIILEEEEERLGIPAINNNVTF